MRWIQITKIEILFNMVKIDNNDDLKRPPLTSNDLKTTSNDKKTRSKNVLKAGSVQEENIVINEHYLDKINKNN